MAKYAEGTTYRREGKNIRQLMYSEQWMLSRHTNSPNKRKENITTLSSMEQ
jgi:hypothetical protein